MTWLIIIVYDFGNWLELRKYLKVFDDSEKYFK